MSSLAAEVQPSPESWKKSIFEKDAVLATQVAGWLKKRGKTLRPKLNDEQKQQLEECFELMDADGSGAIDADELAAAFKLLGLQVNKAEIGQLLDEVDSDGSGEVEYPEFIEIMTSTLAKLAVKKGQQGTAGNQVPFALLATAYRRKRIMEGLISGDKEMTAQVVAIAEEATRRAAEEAAAHQAEEAQAARRRRSSHLGFEIPGSISSYMSSPVTSANSTCSTSHNCAPGSPNTRAAVVMQAGAPGSLLRTLTRIKSMKSNLVLEALGGGVRVPTSSAGGVPCRSPSSCSTDGAGGSSAGCPCAALGMDAVALLSEEEQAQLAELLKLAVHKRMQQSPTPAGAAAAAAAANLRDGSSGRSSPIHSNSSTSLKAPADVAALVGANQHMTSKLQQRVLTQEIQVPKFSLCVARSAADSPTYASRSKSRSRSAACSHASSPAPSASAAMPAAAAGGGGSPTPAAAAAGSGTKGVVGVQRSMPGLCASAIAGSDAASSTSAAAAVQFGDCTVHEHQAQQQRQLKGSISSSSTGSTCIGASSGSPAAVAVSRSTSAPLSAPAVVGVSCAVTSLLPQAGAFSPTASAGTQQPQLQHGQ